MSKVKEEGRDLGGVQVIARAAAILRALGSEGMSLGTLAKTTGLPRSTVQRLVDALASENLVEAGEKGVRPGWGLQQLSQQSYSRVAAIARPALEQLFERTRETVDISVATGREVAFLDRIISDQEVRVVPFGDRPRPLHAMANGKALLSRMTDPQILALTAKGMSRLTDWTIADTADLLRDIAEVRKSGFAYDRQEHASGVCAIGIALEVPGMRPHAMSVVAPAFRYEGVLDQLRSGLEESKEFAERLFAQAGFGDARRKVE